jgi:hypothetical protein
MHSTSLSLSSETGLLGDLKYQEGKLGVIYISHSINQAPIIRIRVTMIDEVRRVMDKIFLNSRKIGKGAEIMRDTSSEYMVGYDVSPDHIPFSRAHVERIAPFVRDITWDSIQNFSASAFGLFRLDDRQIGICHLVNAVGARALQTLVGNEGRYRMRSEPVVGRWPYVDETGEIKGFGSWRFNTFWEVSRCHCLC